MLKQWLKWDKQDNKLSKIEDFTGEEVEDLIRFFNSSGYKKLCRYLNTKDNENLLSCIGKGDFVRGETLGQIDGRKRFVMYIKNVIDFYKKNS